MFVNVVILIIGVIAAFVAYLFGYKKGCRETAFGENAIGKEAFELHAWWGASVGRDKPQASLIEIPQLVRERKSQLERLSTDELLAVRSVEREKASCG